MGSASRPRRAAGARRRRRAWAARGRNSTETRTVTTREELTEAVTDGVAARDVADWGTLTLRSVTTVGQISLIAEDAVRAVHVVLEDVTVERADLRGRSERPHGFGVDVLQGGITVWNRQVDPETTITVAVDGVRIGTEQTFVRGCGLFLAGHGDEDGLGDGGRLTAERVVTGEIHTDGGIPEETPPLISGGVFVLSGIGFVNFADIDLLDVQALVTTHGSGARAFNVYDGVVKEARVGSVEAHGADARRVRVGDEARCPAGVEAFRD